MDGEIAQLSAKLFVTPGLWDTATGKVAGKSAEAVQTNPLLEQIKARIVQHYNRIMQEEDFATAEKVKNAFLGIGVMNRTLMKDYADFNTAFQVMVDNGTRDRSTLTKYRCVYNHLSNFLAIKKNRKDIAYKEITEQFIWDFDKLRKIAIQCGIQKDFTFHSSRHTFATTVILSNGGTIESLSKMMGHKNITTTQIYAKITNEKISRDVEHIIDNLDSLQNKLRAGA